MSHNVKLEQITRHLDAKFNIQNIPPDMPFSKVMPRIYDAEEIEFKKYLTDSFTQSFHGLMIKNLGEIYRVYLSVFLSKEILDKIFAKNGKGGLIFSHHPMEMETSNRGFLPLPEEYFQEIQKRDIAVYVLHTPLDIHEDISTSQSIAKKLKLKNCQRYKRHSIGYEGISGELPEKKNFEDFIPILRKLFGVEEIHFIKRFNNIHRVGIIAGGGADVEYIKETIRLGCDTYLSGDYENKIKNEYSLQKRKEFEEVKDVLQINLIECSHYATEKVVMINEIKELFEGYGLHVAFIEQDNAWY